MGSMIGSMAGGAMGMGGSIIQAVYAHKARKAEMDLYKAQEAQIKEEAQMARNQAQRVAEAQESKAQNDARRKRYNDRLVLEQARNSMSTGGFDIDIGSAMQIQEENDMISRYNTLDIVKEGMARSAETRYSGEQKRRGLLWQAENTRWKRDMLKQSDKFQNALAVVNTMTNFGKQAGQTYQAHQNAKTGNNSWNRNNLDASKNKSTSGTDTSAGSGSRSFFGNLFS